MLSRLAATVNRWRTMPSPDCSKRSSNTETRSSPWQLGEKLGHLVMRGAFLDAFAGGVDFDAVAGGEQHGLGAGKLVRASAPGPPRPARR